MRVETLFFCPRCETVETTQSPKSRRFSFAFPAEQMSPQSKHESADGQGSTLEAVSKDLTCIAEEGMTDIDFQVTDTLVI